VGIFALIVLGIIVLVVLIGLSSAIRIINEYERGVLFRLGRLMALKGPGLRLIIPFGIDRLVKIDLRTVTLEVPPQEVITLDNVTIKVNAVIYFLVVDPRNAVTKVANFINATSQIAQTTLRASSANRRWTSSSPTGRRSIPACKKSSMSRRNPGESRSRPSRS